jgi:hypothetical protein
MGSGFRENIGAFDFGGSFALSGAVCAGKGLSAQSAGSIFWQRHES